jgi:hypothetical protein
MDLPPDVVEHTLSFLVNEQGSSDTDFCNYTNLLHLNKEINSYIDRYTLCYRYLKNDLDSFRREYKAEINKDISMYTSFIPPICSNDGCLLCGRTLPYWNPILYHKSICSREIKDFDKKLKNWNIITNGKIYQGICGHCVNNKDLCFKCLHHYDWYQSLKYNEEDYASEEDCLGCKCLGADYCFTCGSKKNPFIHNNTNLICKDNDEYCSECQNNIMFLI